MNLLTKNPYSPLILSLAIFSTSCLRPPSASDTKVVNGEVSSDFEKTLNLKINKGDIFEYCAGVFIQDNLLLTSGLCLEGAKEVTVLSDADPFKSNPKTSKNFKKHDKFTSKRAETSSNGKTVSYNYVPSDNIYADVGVVIFPKGTAPAALIAKIAESEPGVGDVVFLAGFGAKNLEGEGLGTRRVGKNKISLISDNKDKVINISNERDAGDALMGAGDAGGPLYNESKEIIGITSTKFNSTSTGHYANLSAPSTFDFIKAQMNPSSTGSTTILQTAGNSASGLTKTCEADQLTVRFKDEGSSRSVSVSGCKSASVSCIGKNTLEISSGNSRSSVLISSASNCEKIRDELASKI